MIDKIFNIERLEYKSNLSTQDFKNKLDTIFNQGTFNYKYNLTGKFINDYEFKATDKWTIGLYIRSFENDPAYLKGKIKATNSGIILNVTVRPNSIFSIFGFLFPIAGIFALFATGFGSTNEDGLIVGLAFVIIGLIFYPLGKFLRNRLRKKFEKYLDLKE
jgi:hypothetical protein